MEDIAIRSAIITGVLIAIILFVLVGCSGGVDCSKYNDAASCLQNKCTWDATTNVCKA